MNTILELTESADPASVRRIRTRVADAAAQAGVSGSVVEEIGLCVTEAAANAVRHAYDGAHGFVRVLVESDERRLLVVVRDTGKGMDVSRRASSEGFGLRIIETLCPDFTLWARPGGGIEVRMWFPTEARRPKSRHERSGGTRRASAVRSLERSRGRR